MTVRALTKREEARLAKLGDPFKWVLIVPEVNSPSRIYGPFATLEKARAYLPGVDGFIQALSKPEEH
ncbi:MAG TPA: hypothetical protein VH187_05440 [Scandinavium sp.]|jgi:hypothetical protein|uniref:hypothetical protein n=1 Tax=Scandinavium sp. TaxID=2830653 RepID=UPI002E36CC6A|nr:hypothetical protein [Scandinavium sp.]HEX4500604.1 hypothetical protein [Scandinavium sp.]